MRRSLFISLLFIMISPAKAWADVLIIVRQQAETSGKYVRICDIARVEGPKDLALAVSKTVLGPSPAKGEIREITRWEIEHRIYEVGLETSLLFTGNDSVMVTGNGIPAARQEEEFALDVSPSPEFSPKVPTPVSTARTTPVLPAGEGVSATTEAAGRPAVRGGEIPSGDTAGAKGRNPLSLLDGETRDAAARVISEYLSKQYRRPDVEVEARLVSLSEPLPRGAEMTVEEALEGRIPGKASLALRFADAADGKTKTVTVGVDADVFALAPVAAKPLYKGDILHARDVIIARVRMKPGASYMPPDARAVEGREVQKPLAAGAPVLATDATPTAAVKRGALVAVDASGKGWRLQAAAKALGTGNIDDVIMVEDVSTKAKYQARVVGHGKVAALARRGG